MTIRKRVITALLLFAYCFLMGGQIILSAFSVKVAAAETVTYTNVLDDLKKDPDFDENDFPANAVDHSLEVIQIAETVDKELLIYVYNPCANSKNLTAREIVFSSSLDNEKENYISYKMSLVNSNGVFSKYVVKDYLVSSEASRYYEILSLLRDYDETLDKADGVDSDDLIACEVSQRWTVTTEGDNVNYSLKEIEVVIVNSLYVGYIRYSNGFSLFGNNKCDSHFFAFDTDRDLGTLLEIDCEFDLYHYHYSQYGNYAVPITYEETTPKKVTSKYDEYGTNSPGLFAKQYSWKRISTSEEFIEAVNSDGIELTEEAKLGISNGQWVISFYETTYNDKFILGNDSLGTSTQIETDYYRVTNVLPVRFKFVVDGVVYDLGVVSDKMTGNLTPDGEATDLQAFKGWFADLMGDMDFLLEIVGIILLLLIFSSLLPVLKAFFEFILSMILSVWRFILLILGIKKE